MNTESLDISIGTRLWYQGAAWTVVEHGGDGVLLRSGESFKKVHGASLVGIAEPLGDEVQAETRELDTVVLGTLDRNQRAEIERQAKIFDDVFSTGSHVPADNLYQAAANKLGVSLRTAYRRGQRYANQGIVGLVDARRLKSHHRAIDPEWDTACLEVLQSFRDQSNPTVKGVLAKANALFAARNPSGVTPSRSAGYRRIQELDKGRYTFGAAKQRRSVADRPQGVLGRLRADRPGQYVVLDTTRLDVFAMSDAGRPACECLVCMTPSAGTTMKPSSWLRAEAPTLDEDARAACQTLLEFLRVAQTTVIS